MGGPILMEMVSCSWGGEQKLQPARMQFTGLPLTTASLRLWDILELMTVSLLAKPSGKLTHPAPSEGIKKNTGLCCGQKL